MVSCRCESVCPGLRLVVIRPASVRNRFRGGYQREGCGIQERHNVWMTQTFPRHSPLPEGLRVLANREETCQCEPSLPLALGNSGNTFCREKRACTRRGCFLKPTSWTQLEIGMDRAGCGFFRGVNLPVSKRPNCDFPKPATLLPPSVKPTLHHHHSVPRRNVSQSFPLTPRPDVITPRFKPLGPPRLYV